MKHTVSRLDGPRLDAAVAMAEGVDAKVEFKMTTRPRPVACWRMVDGRPDFDAGQYAPSVLWSQGGPIIQRERIATANLAGAWHAWMPSEFPYRPEGSGLEVDQYDANGSGATTLIAAMRAFVVSKLGEEVELP